MRLVGDGSTPKIGTYRSCDGTTYTVLGIAKHTETGDQLAICLFQRRLWAYPVVMLAMMFAEKVSMNGKRTPKFEFIGELQIQQ